MTFAVTIQFVARSGHLRPFEAEVSAPDADTAREDAIRRFGLSHRRCVVKDTHTIEIGDAA